MSSKTVLCYVVDLKDRYCCVSLKEVCFLALVEGVMLSEFPRNDLAPRACSCWYELCIRAASVVLNGDMVENSHSAFSDRSQSLADSNTVPANGMLS